MLNINTVLVDSIDNSKALNIKIELIQMKSTNLINTGYPPWVNFSEFLSIVRLALSRIMIIDIVLSRFDYTISVKNTM